MRQPTLQLLTYLAQVRQLPFKSELLPVVHAYTMHPFLLIKPSKNAGTSHREIVTIGIVRAAVWGGQNKSTGVWLRVAGSWQRGTIYTSSPSRAKEKKSPMNMQRKTMANGRTGFWMRVEHDLSVKVVNGTMYKLLNAKNASILTHILSPHMHRTILRQRLYASRKNRRADNRKSSYPKCYGLIGLRARSGGRGWGSNTKLPRSGMQRRHLATWQSIFSNPPFSQIVGLPDGSASGIVKVFHQRRRGKQTQ